MSTTNQNRCTATKLVRGEGCGNQTNRGAASCAPIEPETNCAVADLRPMVARLARVGRPAPVGGHRRRGGLRRCSRAGAVRRGRRRGTRRGSGGLGVPAAVIPIVVGVFRPGVVVPIVIDVFGMDHLAAPVGGAVLGTLGAEVLGWGSGDRRRTEKSCAPCWRGM